MRTGAVGALVALVLAGCSSSGPGADAGPTAPLTGTTAPTTGSAAPATQSSSPDGPAPTTSSGWTVYTDTASGVRFALPETGVAAQNQPVTPDGGGSFDTVVYRAAQGDLELSVTVLTPTAGTSADDFPDPATVAAGAVDRLSADDPAARLEQDAPITVGGTPGYGYRIEYTGPDGRAAIWPNAVLESAGAQVSLQVLGFADPGELVSRTAQVDEVFQMLLVGVELP